MTCKNCARLGQENITLKTKIKNLSKEHDLVRSEIDMLQEKNINLMQLSSNLRSQFKLKEKEMSQTQQQLRIKNEKLTKENSCLTKMVAQLIGRTQQAKKKLQKEKDTKEKRSKKIESVRCVNKPVRIASDGPKQTIVKTGKAQSGRGVVNGAVKIKEIKNVQQNKNIDLHQKRNINKNENQINLKNINSDAEQKNNSMDLDICNYNADALENKNDYKSIIDYNNGNIPKKIINRYSDEFSHGEVAFNGFDQFSVDTSHHL